VSQSTTTPCNVAADNAQFNNVDAARNFTTYYLTDLKVRALSPHCGHNQRMSTQSEKGLVFRALHEREGAFIIPNPWDMGTAKLLAQLGFEALATTSAGYAFSAGKPDNQVGRDEVMAHVAAIVSATDLPVSADLENGFGDAPEVAAETLRLAAATGLAGGSIEDGTGRMEDPIYDEVLAVERVQAAVAVVRDLPFRFTLTARAENYLIGRPDLKNTIRRLQSYQEAGADVLYAPGLTKREDIAAVVSSVDRPVNVIMGLQGAQFSLADLSALGVKRVSVGSALSRAALGAFLRAAREMREQGTFAFAEAAASYRDLNSMFATSPVSSSSPHSDPAQ
jgi:2-methylisocitrate lyase-like PEP mutase family enzyme